MENYLTAKEVAAMVQLSEMTIRRYVMKKQIPFHKIVRAVRFKPSEIQKWIEEKKPDWVEGKGQAADLFDEAGGKV
jgi:excisionase family DNA binding protein